MQRWFRELLYISYKGGETLRNLMKAEWFKLSKSFGFKVLCLCNMASILTTVLLLIAGAKGTGYKMFMISLTYKLHHAVIGYLFAAVFLCGEFSGRTFGMSLLCGYPRRKVFLSKILMFHFGSLLLFLIYTGISTIVASIGNGFGQTFSPDILILLFCGILGNAAMGAVMILIAVIVKKSIVTIGVGIGITYALLFMESNFREGVLFFVKYTYSYQLGQLSFWGEGFSLWMFLVVMLLTFVIALVTSILIFEKVELK